MPIGKGDQIRGYGMCGVKATDFAAGPRRNVHACETTIPNGAHCYAQGARYAIFRRLLWRRDPQKM